MYTSVCVHDREINRKGRKGGEKADERGGRKGGEGAEKRGERKWGKEEGGMGRKSENGRTSGAAVRETKRRQEED